MGSRTQEAALAPAETEARLRFERYLSGVAARFLELSPEEVEGHLVAALRGLLDALDIDRCGIALFDEATEGLTTFCNAGRPGIPEQPPVDLAPLLPWYARQVRDGRTLVLPHLPEGLPPEAAAETAHVGEIGMKSHVSVPMEVGGETLGALGCATFGARREWDPQLVVRLELLAGVFAGALHRRRAEARLEAADELNRSILASLPQELVVVSSEGKVLAQNESWSLSAAEEAFPPVAPGEDFADALEWAATHGCHEAVERAGLQKVISGESPRFEGLCEHHVHSGSRQYFVTATPLQGEEPGAVVVHTDVTELQETRAALERSLEEVQALKERLEAENVVLHQQVRRAQGFEEIVGQSPALGRALAQVEQVAPTDAPVLLLGETGTGKDLIARAVHERSRRRERPLVTVNCAALPSTLVESEVFGYEKGAFTGALQRTVGRFEVADGGTLFLDEIGELPLEVQGKLLRVLQTGEFERLGSSKTVKVDVRLVTATNRDLEREVREGRFRPDLFYRLSVFPVTLPPLRERPEDIPLLVWHFVERRQAGLGRQVKRIPERLMRAFTAYPWPGNVRELENVVERALIMTTGDTLAADPAFLEAAPAVSAAGPTATLAEAERAHILAVLDDCGWKVSGRGNAAERLGLSRTTLQSRMKKLGITRPRS
jgi:transcriptional regulator with GAF, ATPase, and Fis domain